MEKINISNRLARYDNVKFWLILAVVVEHFAEPYVGKSHMMTTMTVFLYGFHMPLFIFICGLFSKRVIQKPEFSGEKIGAYLALYMILKMFLYCIRLICGEIVSFQPLAEFHAPWFALSCACFIFITHLLKRYDRRVICIVVFVISCLAGYHDKLGDFLCLSRTLVFYPFFLMGYYLPIETLEKMLHKKGICILSLTGLCFLAVRSFFYTDKMYALLPLLTGNRPFSMLAYPQWGFLYRLVYYMRVFFLFPGILWLASERKFFFTKFGTKTLQIYFWHMPLLILYLNKWNGNVYLAEVFPHVWKIIYLLLGVALTCFLTTDFFAVPCKQIMQWKLKLPYIKNGKNLPGKRRFIMILPIAFSFAFTLGIFGPMDLWFSNASDFWFDKTSAALVSVFLFFLIFSVSIFLGMLVNGNTFLFYLTCLFSLSFAFYVQGTFLNIGFEAGVLDGGEIIWGEYETYGLVNTFIWGALFILPLIVTYFLSKKSIKIFSFISLVIVGMQIPALIFSALHTDDAYSGPKRISTEGIYTLSQNENILIFVLDTMDEQYFNEFIENNPLMKENLQGFIHFDNTLASGARTMQAMPSILTGIPYKREKAYSEYLEDIWNGESPLDILTKEDYDVRIFTDTLYCGDGASACIRNFSVGRQNVGSYKILTEKLGKLTLYRYAPYLLKKAFWMATSEFESAKASGTYSTANTEFYNNYKKEHFTYTNEYSKALRLYHLQGIHEPYTLMEDGSIGNSTREEQVKGLFHILFDMLSDLKADGMWDRTMIIITADHGDIVFGQQPIFLCKLPYAQGDMQTNHAPISLFDLPSTLVNFAGGNGELYGSGRNLFQISETEVRERIFYFNTSENSKPCIKEYITSGRADNVDAMILNNKYFPYNDRVQPYSLGNFLSFAAEATANVYCTKGFGTASGGETDIQSPVAQMVIPLEEAPKSTTLHAHVGIALIRSIPDVVIRSGEFIIFEGSIDNSFVKTGLDLEIPVSTLKNNTITLNFETTSTFWLSSLVIEQE